MLRRSFGISTLSPSATNSLASALPEVDPIRIGLQGKFPEYFELFVLQQI
jgi:hypothetical protein